MITPEGWQALASRVFIYELHDVRLHEDEGTHSVDQSAAGFTLLLVICLDAAKDPNHDPSDHTEHVDNAFKTRLEIERRLGN